MIDIKKAYVIALDDAKKNYEDAELQVCTDIGGRFAFSVGFEGGSIKGASLITVDKNTGDIGYLNLPNEENFELLRNGTGVDIAGMMTD